MLYVHRCFTPILGCQSARGRRMYRCLGEKKKTGPFSGRNSGRYVLYVEMYNTSGQLCTPECMVQGVNRQQYGPPTTREGDGGQEKGRHQTETETEIGGEKPVAIILPLSRPALKRRREGHVLRWEARKNALARLAATAGCIGFDCCFISAPAVPGRCSQIQADATSY